MEKSKEANRAGRADLSDSGPLRRAPQLGQKTLDRPRRRLGRGSDLSSPSSGETLELIRESVSQTLGP